MCDMRREAGKKEHKKKRKRKHTDYKSETKTIN